VGVRAAAPSIADAYTYLVRQNDTSPKE